MSSIETLEKSYETLLGLPVQLLIKKPIDIVKDIKSPLSVNIAVGSFSNNTNLAAQIYGVLYKETNVVTTSLFEPLDGGIGEFANTICRLLTKRFGLPTYVSVSTTVGLVIDSSDQISVIDTCVKTISIKLNDN
ncbi:HBR147Wp [Eremothecium sinecaudum]|uniref:HBR147Wp n=1 Tax=Eremothecium sinecaudum TaxID=45286 RepID=A0A109UWW9_9SACH|nr:HBR147Wp [Eremothecium sinecaudum]AMD19048.1 HBR147Wp [Eremothecium sinecaudum]